MTIGNVQITLSGVVDTIILIGAVCTAVYKIWDFFAKPTTTLKQKKAQKDKKKIIATLDEVLPNKIESKVNELLPSKVEEKLEGLLDNMLPDKLIGHDLEVRERYKADRANYLTLIDLITTAAALELVTTGTLIS